MKEQEVQVCAKLRTKSYYVLGRFHSDTGESSPTSVYWCLHTMHSYGSDGGYVSPETCRAGRCCFNDCS